MEGDSYNYEDAIEGIKYRYSQGSITAKEYNEGLDMVQQRMNRGKTKAAAHANVKKTKNQQYINNYNAMASHLKRNINSKKQMTNDPTELANLDVIFNNDLKMFQKELLNDVDTKGFNFNDDGLLKVRGESSKAVNQQVKNKSEKNFKKSYKLGDSSTSSNNNSRNFVLNAKFSSRELKKDTVQRTNFKKPYLNKSAPGGFYRGKIKSPDIMDNRTKQITAAIDKGSKQLSSLEKSVRPAEKIMIRISNRSFGGKVGLALGAGATFSLATKVKKKFSADEQDTDINEDTSRFLKSSLVAGTGIAALDKTRPMYEGLNARHKATMKADKILDKAPKNMSRNLEHVYDSGEKLATAHRLNRNTKSLGSVGKIGAGLIGVATAVDLFGKAKDSHDVKKADKEQIKEWKKEQQEKGKVRRKHSDYGSTNYGQLTMDLFEDAIGHHKMGNARYYQ